MRARFNEPPSVSCSLWFISHRQGTTNITQSMSYRTNSTHAFTVCLRFCFFWFFYVRSVSLILLIFCVVFFVFLYPVCALHPVFPVSLDILFVTNTTIFSSVYLRIKQGKTTVVHSIALNFFVLVFLPQCDYWFTSEHVCGKISSIWSIYLSVDTIFQSLPFL